MRQILCDDCGAETLSFQPLWGPDQPRQERVGTLQSIPTEGNELQGCGRPQKGFEVLPHTGVELDVELHHWFLAALVHTTHPCLLTCRIPLADDIPSSYSREAFSQSIVPGTAQ